MLALKTVFCHLSAAFQFFSAPYLHILGASSLLYHSFFQQEFNMLYNYKRQPLPSWDLIVEVMPHLAVSGLKALHQWGK